MFERAAIELARGGAEAAPDQLELHIQIALCPDGTRHALQRLFQAAARLRGDQLSERDAERAQASRGNAQVVHGVDGSGSSGATRVLQRLGELREPLLQ